MDTAQPTASLRFQIGQAVWWASFDTETVYVECPDCGGTGRIRCILHDDTMVSVECAGCRVGYDPPKGAVTTYERKPRARATVITGVELREAQPPEWRTADSYRIDDSELFETEAEAHSRAQEKAAEWAALEEKRIATKEKDTRSWAWNAHYHRKCLKEAQRNIEYHSKKLAVANLKAKQDKAALSQANEVSGTYNSTPHKESGI